MQAGFSTYGEAGSGVYYYVGREIVMKVIELKIC